MEVGVGAHGRGDADVAVVGVPRHRQRAPLPRVHRQLRPPPRPGPPPDTPKPIRSVKQTPIRQWGDAGFGRRWGGAGAPVPARHPPAAPIAPARCECTSSPGGRGRPSGRSGRSGQSPPSAQRRGRAPARSAATPNRADRPRAAGCEAEGTLARESMIFSLRGISAPAAAAPAPSLSRDSRAGQRGNTDARSNGKLAVNCRTGSPPLRPPTAPLRCDARREGGTRSTRGITRKYRREKPSKT